MESSVIRRSAVAGLAVRIGAGLATAPQNTKAMDFTGKTIKIVIPYGPGGMVPAVHTINTVSRSPTTWANTFQETRT